jgi:ATP-binding cassette subfamily A (ABC1) protein 5
MFINQALEDFDLLEHSSTLARNLSGGEQRKLSVAIAILGDPEVLILDEPSSGMDPTARRRLWERLRDWREKRLTIISTHYMDEAEVLCDRLALMKDGKIKCSGSPLFLKQHIGIGYNLTIKAATGNHD